jgi:hypothetical protein
VQRYEKVLKYARKNKELPQICDKNEKRNRLPGGTKDEKGSPRQRRGMDSGVKAGD